MAGTCAALALSGAPQAWAQSTVVTPTVDLGATADPNGAIGLNVLTTPPTITDAANLRQGTPAQVSFDVQRYNGPRVLTGFSFSALVGATNIAYNTPLIPQSGVVALGSTVTLGGGSAQGYALAYRVLGLGGNTVDAYSTATGFVDASQLANFYGSGTAVGAGTWTEQLTVDRIGLLPGFSLQANPGAHTAAVTYSAVTAGHADGSFTGIPGDNTATLRITRAGQHGFNIYNGLGLFGMDLENIQCTGQCSLFTMTGSFAQVAGGGWASGNIGWQGPAAGPGTATYTFQVSDTQDSSVVGLGRQRNLETLTLTVTAVPEPSAYLLALMGVAGIGWQVRRQRRERRQRGRAALR
jgi:hypothetical protein